MKHVFALFLLCFALCCSIFISCQNQADTDTVAPQMIKPTDTTKRDNQLIMALLYQQRAAEYRALCMQCYNLAKLRLDAAMRDKALYKSKMPFAIITDLDETALDNSGNEAWLYGMDSAYNQKEFDYWCIHGQAGAVPGSVAFFRYADSVKDRLGRKIDIYYISNRTDSMPVIDSTMGQMKRLGFPQLGRPHFLFKASTAKSSKEPRRQLVATGHYIVELLGDNLIDLNKAFDGTTADSTTRRYRVDSLSAEWGGKYIVLPNAEYGDWEAALYKNGSYSLLPNEKVMRVQDLKVYPLKTGLK